MNASNLEKVEMRKEINTWKELVNRLTDENTSLKHIIEDLECRNKQFSETLNTHMYNRAAEYKSRMLNALRSSPARIAGGGAPRVQAEPPKTP